MEAFALPRKGTELIGTVLPIPVLLGGLGEEMGPRRKDSLPLISTSYCDSCASR